MHPNCNFKYVCFLEIFPKLNYNNHFNNFHSKPGRETLKNFKYTIETRIISMLIGKEIELISSNPNNKRIISSIETRFTFIFVSLIIFSIHQSSLSFSWLQNYNLPFLFHNPEQKRINKKGSERRTVGGCLTVSHARLKYSWGGWQICGRKLAGGSRRCPTNRLLFS